MKALSLVVLLSSSPLFANEVHCTAEMALRDYYVSGGQEIQNFKFEDLSGGIFSVEYDDLDGPAHCTGGTARVDFQSCEATPIKALYCD